MSKSIDNILKELGMETPDLPPINKREAIEMGLVQGKETTKPEKGICGKSVFSSETKCKEAIKHRLRAGFGGTSFLRAYFCDQCAGWHMSSSHTKHNK
jgi:hypothetical protein